MDAGKLTGKHYAFEGLGERIALISRASFSAVALIAL